MKNTIRLNRFIKNKLLREWIEAALFALIIAAIFRTWLYAPYRIPTGSMIHTIEIGDQLFVNQHAYGFKIPFTQTKLFLSSVQRGDIIVFPYPLNPKIDFIKRVIGMQGDKIELSGEKVYINGTLEVAEYLYYDPAAVVIPENRTIIVPPGKLWVMGDNRRNSSDSRVWGFVDEISVKGKGTIIYWSHNPTHNLLTGYRFDRIATLLH